MGHGFVGLEPDRLAQASRCFVMLALANQGAAEADQRIDIFGLEPDCLAEGDDGLIELALGLRGIPQILKGLLVTRPKEDRLAADVDRLFVLTLVMQPTEIDKGPDVDRLEPDRLAVLGDGIV